jgi:hypothetical protein
MDGWMAQHGMACHARVQRRLFYWIPSIWSESKAKKNLGRGGRREEGIGGFLFPISLTLDWIYFMIYSYDFYGVSNGQKHLLAGNATNQPTNQPAIFFPPNFGLYRTLMWAHEEMFFVGDTTPSQGFLGKITMETFYYSRAIVPRRRQDLVAYFTQVLWIAVGLSSIICGFDVHFVSSTSQNVMLPLLQTHG